MTTDNDTSKLRVKRLRELVKVITGHRERWYTEFYMRVPAEPDHDADLVISWAASEIESLQRDADRYRYLRDEDNWGDDCDPVSWEVLGEAHAGEFDAIVDARMAVKHA